MTLPSGTVTFLFTDIEGSTKLAQEHINTWESLKRRHDAILQTAITAHNGYVFQIVGDAFCASFHTAGDALLAAVKAQVDLYAENWGDAPVKSRMGIHTGKAEIQESGDYIGYATLSRIQRLMSAGHGGQTLLSQTTQELIRDELPQGITLRDMGERRLKDLIHPEHIYQVEIPNLPTEFPALKTLDVQLNNLPAQTTHFIGREREIAAVLGLMRNPDVRLVTLTGAGGTGKTRLSLQAAADLSDDYEHGVWFVELASISDPGLVLPTIASTLKVKESAGLSIEQALHEYLSKHNLLLVIDNFEQVVNAAPVIGKLLSAAPKVKVLTSSREILHLRGEHDYPVPPLGLPESKRKQTAVVLAQYEAIALFIQHARAANSAFELDDENAPVIAEICMKLDGLPLAIELAAARSRLLKPAVMLEKLKSRLNVLTGGARDLPHRQQTIRGAIDWSYELLDEAEKILFTRLGVFVGGWIIESAEAVCGEDVLSGLESLLDKSLIRQVEGRSGETRFTMLETIREYAQEKLSQSGELSAIQQAHANYMNELFKKVSGAANNPDEAKWFAALDDEFDNLRSTMEWALAHQQPKLAFQAVGLFDYWFRRGIFLEPLRWLERALETDESGAVLKERAWAMHSASGLLQEIVGDTRRSRAYLEPALDLFREIGDQNGITRCLNGLGDLELREKNFDQARQLYEQSLVSAETDTFGKAMSFINLGNLARIRGEWETARDDFLQARAICERLGAESGVSFANSYLGKLATAQRQLDLALAYFESYVNAAWARATPIYNGLVRGLPGYIHLLLGNKKEAQRMLSTSIESMAEYIQQNQSGNFFEFWCVLEGKARLETMNGKAARAAQLFGTAWTQREKDNFALTEAERPDYETAIAEARSAIGKDAFDQAFAKGQAMSFSDAVEFAVDETNE